MTIITPGVAFLAHHLIPPSVVSAALASICSFLELPLPRWTFVLLALLAVPAQVIFNTIRKEWSDRREAEAMGARLAPRVQGKLLGNFDVLKELMGYWRTGYPGDGIWELIAEYGPIFNTRILWTNTIVTISPECIKLILATDFDNYVKGDRFRTALMSFLGNGVFNSDGDMWKFHRSMTRPFFNKDRVTDFELFDRYAQTAIAHIKERMKTGRAIDFQDLMHRFTMDSATDFLFGSCVGALQVPAGALPLPFDSPSSVVSSREDHPVDSFSNAFLEAQILVSTRDRLGWIWPLYEIFGDKTIKPMSVVNAYLEPIIKKAVQKKMQKTGEDASDGKTRDGIIRDDETAEKETLLDHLVNMTSDTALLKDEILNILIAARDTMAATLTFVVYFLSLHPHVMSRLREEILDKVGPTRRPTFEDTKEMKYLKAVINETLRLLPPVPFDVRECVSSTTWPSPDPSKKPIFIPAGASTPYAVVMMHVRKDLWGPDADVFDPDRFLDHRLKQYLLPNPFIFLPFNAGPRICLGQQFAYNEMSFILIRLLQNFSSISLDTEAFPPDARPPSHWAEAKGESRKSKEKFKPKIVLTMSSQGGMWVKMRGIDEV